MNETKLLSLKELCNNFQKLGKKDGILLSFRQRGQNILFDCVFLTDSRISCDNCVEPSQYFISLMIFNIFETLFHQGLIEYLFWLWQNRWPIKFLRDLIYLCHSDFGNHCFQRVNYIFHVWSQRLIFDKDWNFHIFFSPDHDWDFKVLHYQIQIHFWTHFKFWRVVLLVW